MPSGEEHEIEVNETILHLAQREGLHIQSVCKGIPSCAECRVQLKEGEHHVLPPSKKEIDLIGTAHYIDRSRLACQLRCFGDVTVDLSEQVEKEKRSRGRPNDRMARSDGQESKAVLGGILDNVVAEGVELPEEEVKVKEKVKVEAFKGQPNLDKRDSFYGDFYNKKKKKKSQGKKKKSKNNNRNRNSQSASGSSSEGATSNQPNKKKRRSRNRKRPNQASANKPQQNTKS